MRSRPKDSSKLTFPRCCMLVPGDGANPSTLDDGEVGMNLPTPMVNGDLPSAWATAGTARATIAAMTGAKNDRWNIVRWSPRRRVVRPAGLSNVDSRRAVPARSHVLFLQQHFQPAAHADEPFRVRCGSFEDHDHASQTFLKSRFGDAPAQRYRVSLQHRR